MLAFSAYLIVVLAELLFFIGFSIYAITMIYSHIKGAPYVPTTHKEVDFILKSYKMKKGDKFLDLGCGDGRVSLRAAQLYKLQATGIDINPLLIKLAEMKAAREKVKNVNYLVSSVFDINLKPYKVIYVFLMPDLVKKIVPKFRKELETNTIIVSHGFKIDEFQKYLFKTINHHPFPTYFYRFRPN